MELFHIELNRLWSETHVRRRRRIIWETASSLSGDRHEVWFEVSAVTVFWGVKVGVEITASPVRGLMMLPIRAGVSLYFLSLVWRVQSPRWPSHMIIGCRRMRSHPALRWPAARYRRSGRAGRSRTHDSQLGSNAQLLWTFTKRAHRTELILNIITHNKTLYRSSYASVTDLSSASWSLHAPKIMRGYICQTFTCRVTCQKWILLANIMWDGHNKYGIL